MAFDYSEKSPGRGLDEYGAPVRRRYQRGDRVRELAVLVGNFPSIDDPDAQEALERIKTMRPNALQVKDGQHTSQSMAQVREWQDPGPGAARQETRPRPDGPSLPVAQSAPAARVFRA